ncbi:MAG: stage II sporulation protein R [Lachnoclostridium sp.]|nr:stage II sporulation protein R [Lachnoclostridium sp.]
MKKKCFLIGFTLVIVIGLVFTYTRRFEGEAVSDGIANHVIRLHIIANSDMGKDQELKMAVKEEVVKEMRTKLAESKDINCAREILTANLGQMEEIAKEEMKKRGYSYTAGATLSRSFFPVKKYGDMTFPEGQYEAVKIQLGEAKGKNWWCVMYPTLCFVDSTYQVVPEESKDILKKDLTQEEYQSLLEGENITFDFKFLEWVEKLFQ